MLYAWVGILGATLVINTIFVLTLLAALTWDERAIFLFATVLLAGGLLFTIRTIRSLAPRPAHRR
jgi:hypothetical protein